MRTRTELISQAAKAAIELNRQLVCLIDAFDLYVRDFPAHTPSEHLELNDIHVSIQALGELPYYVANQLKAWLGDGDVSPKVDFEITILNEFALHMFAVQSFMFRKRVDLRNLTQEMIQQSFNAIRESNRLMAA